MLKYSLFVLLFSAALLAVSCNRSVAPTAAAAAKAPPAPALPANRPSLSAKTEPAAPPQAVNKATAEKAPRDDEGAETTRNRTDELPAGERLNRDLSRPQPTKIKDSPQNPYPAGQKQNDGGSAKTRGSSRTTRTNAVPAPAPAESAASTDAASAQASMTMRATPRPAEPMATLRRTACYGTCPVYTLSVYPDGTLRYEGVSNVEMMGDFMGKTDEATVKALGRFATTNRYFTYKKRYPAGDEWATDLPTVVTAMAYNGFENEVEHQFGGPEALTELEQRLEELIGKTVWTKAATGK